MPKSEATCAQCGKSFSFYPSARPGVTCSPACSLRYQPRKPRRGTETPCETCGKPVYANKSQRAKGQGRYCSTACHAVARSETPTIKACPVCGKGLRLKPSQAARIYCSNACQGAASWKVAGDRTYNGRPVRYDHSGYLLVWEPEHPSKSYRGWQFEHRLVMEARLGRHLKRAEVVHHINGVKDDNRAENLELMGDREHAALSARNHRDDVAAKLDRLAEYERRFGALEQEN